MKQKYRKTVAAATVISMMTASILPCNIGFAAPTNYTAYAEQSEIGVFPKSNETDEINTLDGAVSIKKSLFDKVTPLEKGEADIEVYDAQKSVDDIINGSWGSNIKYSLDTSTGILTISGSGAMDTCKADYSDMPFFAYRDQIKQVIFEEGITSICNYAFAFCMDLEQVKLPSTLETIESAAFLSCHSLIGVEIPDSVKEIGDYAIGYYCENGLSGTYKKHSSMCIYGNENSTAQSYAVEKEISFFSSNDLKGSCGENLTYEFDPELMQMTISGNGDMTDYESYSDSPFQTFQQMITSVVIEEGVTSIGENAFYNCSQIADVKFPSTLNKIGASAFSYCYSLTDIKLPDSLTALENYAFLACEKLKTVYIPANITSISPDTFSYCSELREVTIDKKNTSYKSINGIVYDAEMTYIVVYPAMNSTTTYEVPSGITYLDTIISNAKNLQCIIIPESVTTAYDSTFKNCTSLKQVIFLGNAPKQASYYSELPYMNPKFAGNVNISCSFSKTGWEQMMKDATDTENIVWSDLDELTLHDSLEIVADTNEIQEGGNLKLKAVITPLNAVEFNWQSENPYAAVVDKDGNVIGLNVGTAVITCTSADGAYNDSITITVTKNPNGGALKPGIYDLDAEMVEKPFLSMQIASETLNGMYFLNNNTLYFYSLITGTYSQVFRFNGSDAAYVANEKLYVLNSSECQVYDLKLQKQESSISVPVGFSGDAVGADSLGRVYIAAHENSNTVNNRIFLMSAEGELLSDCSFPTRVYSFDGFDNSNGKFYIESFYNYYSWGYDHDGKGLTMGQANKDNTIYYVDTQSGFLEGGLISRTLGCIEYLCQFYFGDHQNGAEILDDKYLVTASTSRSYVNIMDSDSETLDSLMSVSRDDPNYTFVGTRTLYNENNDSLIIYENDNILNEYGPYTKDILSSYSTQHPVYSLNKIGNTVLAVESDDGNYYLEVIDWSNAENIKITAGTDEMNIGSTQLLQVEDGTARNNIYKWSSSDNNIVSITPTGKITAWKSGSAVITCQSQNGKTTASYTITVLPKQAQQQPSYYMAKGKITNNCSANNYSVWGHVVNSYLYENSDGTRTRVECQSDKGVLVEKYANDYTLKESNYLKAELPIFGGFYSGADYNYLVFGKANENESDSAEIMRIVKYSKDWERLGDCSVNGANTYIPFDAGSLRMDETDKELYIHTCHEMYAGSDELHHQANMTYVMDINNMSMNQSYYDVMNFEQAGYVSHSFNQFVKTDDKYAFRVDHGDGYPRCITLSRCSLDGEITNIKGVYVHSMENVLGNNDTGVSVGGFEISDENCLIAFNSVDVNGENIDPDGHRNVYLALIDKNMTKRDIIKVTDHNDNSNITTYTPQLVKISDDAFLVMWEELNTKTYKTCVKMVTYNGTGTQTSEVITKNVKLSDCQPILTSDHKVNWYVSNGSALIFYSIDPYDLDSIDVPSIPEGKLKGDANEDGVLNIRDAAFIARKAAEGKLSQIPDWADYNDDGSITIRDAAAIARNLASIYF